MIADITDTEVAQLEAELRHQKFSGCYIGAKDDEHFVNWPVPDVRAKNQPATRLETKRVTREQAHQLVEAGATWIGPTSTRP